MVNWRMEWGPITVFALTMALLLLGLYLMLPGECSSLFVEGG